MGQANPELVIDFGQAHRGKTIEDCPSSYLRWICETFNARVPRWTPVVEAAEAELAYRDQHGHPKE